MEASPGMSILIGIDPVGVQIYGETCTQKALCSGWDKYVENRRMGQFLAGSYRKVKFQG